MAEPSRYTPEQLSILLRIAAGKLGRDPVKLQEELQTADWTACCSPWAPTAKR